MWNKSRWIEKTNTNRENVFHRLWSFADKLKSTLWYKLPDVEDSIDKSWNLKKWIVRLYWWSEIEEMKKCEKFIDENNCRIQIWKMTNWQTIYSRDLIWHYLLKYLSKHAKDDKKVVIQVRGKMAELLLQPNDSHDDESETGDQIKSFDDEKAEIENYIKKFLKRKWKNIIIQDVSEKYSDVFEALKNWKNWIIPEEEPKLSDLSWPLESPLPIIRYLAYHCAKDEDWKLMKLFYDTKPIWFRVDDQNEWRKPWDSDADYYSVVEVWIRLFEVLNWITIQWWIGRQRVYDKIISTILFGEDRIWEYTESIKIDNRKIKKTNELINIWDFNALKELYEWIKLHNTNNPAMEQIYVDLNTQQLTEIEKERDGNKIAKKRIRDVVVKTSLMIALLFAWWYARSSYIENEKLKEKQKKEETEQQYRRELNSQVEWQWYLYDEFCGSFLTAQQNILMAEYNISPYSKREFSDESCWIDNNDVLEDYTKEFWAHLRDPKFSGGRFLSADEYYAMYAWDLIKQHLMKPQKPYEHFLMYKDVIQNTLEYWNKIDISNCKVQEITNNKRPEISYFIKDKDGPIDANRFYRLKIMRVYPNDWNGKSVDLIFACKTYFSTIWYSFENDKYTIEDWVICMENFRDQFATDLPEIFNK